MLDPEIISLTQSLSEGQRAYFMSRYTAKEKQVSTAYICWVFSVYYFYLGKPGKNILFWISCFFLIGGIWWIICAFRMKGLVAAANKKIALDLINEAKLMVPEDH